MRERLMSEERWRLSTGEELVIEHLDSPVSEQQASEVSSMVVPLLDETFLFDLLRGTATGAPRIRLLVARSDGTIAATCWMGWRESLPALAVVGGVVTLDAYRGRGIATRLCRRLCDIFEENGGRTIWLAAKSAGARRIYSRLGFKVAAGKLMYRESVANACFEGFQPGQAVRARRPDWGDMAALVPLYAWPHECMLLDAEHSVCSSRLGGTDRCIGHFWHTWRTTIPMGGDWSVLENESGWLVASALARRCPRLDGGTEYRTDFIWHPDYEADSRGFVEDFLERLEHEQTGAVTMLAAEADEWKLRQARLLGFGEPIETPRTISIGNRRVKLCLLQR